MDIYEVVYVFNKVMGSRSRYTAAVDNGNCIVRRSDGEKVVILVYDGTFATLPANKGQRSAKALLMELRGYYSPQPRRPY